MIRLWPKDYEKKEHITREERNILRTAAKYFDCGHMVIGIDPIGMSTNDIRMGLFMLPEKGLVTFSIHKGGIDPTLIPMYKMAVELAEAKIYERLLDAKALIVRNGGQKMLKFPYKHVILFHDEDLANSACTKEQLAELSPYAVAKFFRPLEVKGKIKTVDDLNIFGNIKKQYDSAFSKMSQDEEMAVFERLAPEYTIVMPEKTSVSIKEVTEKISDEKLLITGNEAEYRTFWLDEYQVAVVNEMGKGHRVILANPGAGKSVLLLSKAFKYASMYKESKVLLTCYNSNLADSYKFKAGCADFGNNKNLHIMTLHSLVNHLYKDILKVPYYSDIETAEDIQKCLEYVNNGRITIRFKAIFIDEVQIFEPLYLDLCYALLENSEDSLFLMAGDLNQNVRTQSRRGDAPWKKMNNVSLDFTGRVRYIEKNYRNSQQIGNFLNRMLCYMNLQMDKMNMISLKEFEYNVFEEGNREGIALEVKSGVSRMKVVEAVIKALDEIVDKHHIPYSDVAILYPVKQNKAIKYYFQYWLKQELDKRGIKYSFISPSDDPNDRVRYSNTSGVVISSISSSLGLDFKAVILAGLYPYNYIFTNNIRMSIKSWKEISALNEEQKADVQKEMRELYTACSRARDALYIISDLDKGSPMEEIILGGK